MPVAGCSRSGRPEPPRYPISGTVTLDGQPLKDGKVQLVTVSQGLIETFKVKNGRFSGKAAAGERRVELYVIKEVPYAESGFVPMPGEITPAMVRIQVLPPHLNTESAINVTVVPSGKNKFTLDLTSQAPAEGASK
ncbi:MAG: hypothetical protein ACKOEM_16165 [Planctomycetia bacterium]